MSDKQGNKTGFSDSIDSMAAGAANAAKTAGQIAKKTGDIAGKSAKAAKAGKNAAATAAKAAGKTAKVGKAAVVGSAAGPVGTAVGLAWEFKEELYKLLTVVCFSLMFIICAVAALPNVLFDYKNDFGDLDSQKNYSLSSAYSETADAIEQSVRAGYNANLAKLAKAVTKEGCAVTLDTLSNIVSGDGTYEAGDTYVYISDPTKMIGLDYDASYIMAVYSASLLNVPNYSETEGVLNGTAKKDMLNKLDTVRNDMFSYNISKSTEEVTVPAEYYTYSSAGSFTCVLGTTEVTLANGTTTERKILGTKDLYLRNTTTSTTDTEITLDDYTLIPVQIPVPTLYGTTFVTRYYYERNGTRTISPSKKTLTYINCAVSNFNEDCILKAFNVNEYELFASTSKQNWEVIESLKYNINQSIGINNIYVPKVYSSSINGEILSKNGIPWYRVDVNAANLPEIEEPLESYADDIPVFTGSDSETVRLKEFFPTIEDGTVAKTIKQGLMILYKPDGTAEKIFSSEYYTSQAGAFICPLQYEDIYCSSDYGYRYINGQYKMHSGIDMCCWSGTLNKNVEAAAAGVVTYSGFNAYGNCVMIDHGNGIVTLYGHLNSRKVSVGDTVAQGQLIGLAGNTYGPGGYSTGAHLHFEIRVNEERVSPRTYVELPALAEW